MAWYESQLIGVFVGALIVFGTQQANRFFERKREKRNLIAGIKAEVRVLIDFLETNLKDTRKYRKILKEKGNLPRMAYLGGFELRFVDKNLDKFGILDERLLVKTTELRGLLDAHHIGMKSLVETLIPMFKDGKSDIASLELFLRSDENSLEKMVKLGGEILSI